MFSQKVECLFLALYVLASVTNGKPVELSTICGYQTCNRIKHDALNVHIIVHSHDDVGWLKTVQQYYDGSREDIQFANVSQIISAVVGALQENPDRRFIQVETLFFHKWWHNQNEDTRQIVHKLVKNGQFEFVGGAWSMNDEAVTDFHSIIEQFTFGLKFLNDTFGTCGQPKVGWQIDPFGHSSEMASIFAQMGYDGMFFPRIDYKDKQARVSENRMEMIWQGSLSLGDESNIFTSVMFNHYTSPEGFCFDVTCTDDDIVTDPNNPKYNFEHMINKLTSIIIDAAEDYPTNNLLLPMGGDFNYMKAQHYYKNLDDLIKGFIIFPQKYKDQPINVFYSTPGCYMKAVNDVVNAKKIKLSKEVNDFFPYGTDYQTYWTGYFTSRPASKRSIRKALNLLQVHKQLAAFSRATSANELFEMQNAVGIMQHHDAVTGTEKQHVSDDYAKIMHEAFLDSGSRINEHISKLLSKDPTKTVQLNLKQCLLMNVTICPEIAESSEFTIVLYNPLSSKVKYPARIPVNTLDWNVYGPNKKKILYQLVPSIAYKEENSSKYEMTIVAELPPLGMKVFHVRRSDFINFILKEDDTEDRYTLGGKKTSITLDLKTGLLESVKINNIKTKMQQELLYYKSKQNNGRNSGAYVFRNDGDAVPIAEGGVQITTYKGEVFDEVHQVYSDWAKQVIRVYKDADLADSIEFDWLVGPLPVGDSQGKEIINRFTSDLETGHDFWTDANGRDMMHRVRDKRPTYEPGIGEQVSSNYYPITSEIAIADGKVRMAVVNDRSQGGSSIKSGQIEVMVHRATLRDDYWGVGEPLNENEFGEGVKARGRHYLILTNIADRGVAKNIAINVAFAPWMLIGEMSKTYYTDINWEFVGLKGNVPEMVRVLTLEPITDKKELLLLRLENYFDAESGKPQTIFLKNLFTNFEIHEIEEMDLAGNSHKRENGRLSWFDYKLGDKSNASLEVTLNPMQIKTFLAHVKYN